VASSLKRELGLRDLTLFALTCVVSTRWIPLAAHAGPASVTLWLLSAVLFVVPLTVCVAAMVAKFPGAGGLYIWAREDFGPWHGFFSAWVYWMGIAFLFPTAAMLYARVGFSLLRPAHAHLGDDRVFLLAATLALVWLALGSNLVGLQIGKWAENVGALATAATATLLVATAWLVWSRRGSATVMDITPTWNWGTVNFWAAIAYATSGMEAPAMMAAEVKNPEATMRRAGWIASALAAALYTGATIAFLIVLRPEHISELNGYADVANSAGALLGVAWLSPLIAVLVLASGVGFIGGIGTATARLSFAAATDGLLPETFARVHPRWKTPHVSILALGAVATVLLVFYQAGDSLRAAYDELVSLMVITGFMPYLYIFASGWKARRRVSAISGTAVTVLAIACATVPPDAITNVWLFEGKLAAGTLLVAISAWLVYRSRRSASVEIAVA